MQALQSVDENIIIVVDQKPDFLLSDGASPVPIVQQGLHLYLNVKQKVKPTHGFALCSMEDKAKDLSPFDESFEVSASSLSQNVSGMLLFYSHTLVQFNGLK